VLSPPAAPHPAVDTVDRAPVSTRTPVSQRSGTAPGGGSVTGASATSGQVEGSSSGGVPSGSPGGAASGEPTSSGTTPVEGTVTSNPLPGTSTTIGQIGGVASATSPTALLPGGRLPEALASLPALGAPVSTAAALPAATPLAQSLSALRASATSPGGALGRLAQ
jgi:hypothetical protein